MAEKPDKRPQLFIAGFPQKSTSGWLNNHIRTLFCIDFICLHMFYAALSSILCGSLARVHFYQGQTILPCWRA